MNFFPYTFTHLPHLIHFVKNALGLKLQIENRLAINRRKHPAFVSGLEDIWICHFDASLDPINMVR
jgi:hypothetical protein